MRRYKHVLRTRVDDHTLRSVLNAAIERGISPSEWVRVAVERALRVDHIPPENLAVVEEICYLETLVTELTSVLLNPRSDPSDRRLLDLLRRARQAAPDRAVVLLEKSREILAERDADDHDLRL